MSAFMNDKSTGRTKAKPVDHFRACPLCGEKELIHVNPDVVCSICNWDSTEWDVMNGGMDDLRAASKEYERGALAERRDAPPIKKKEEDLCEAVSWALA